ncbi:hypothetical protein [Streptomyces sp. TBY4]|uniref:hypothetical protein n=1 Tax=Streptomyces sp. TBY4 TaxID=2962030 RepID=UPI0020B713D5|nr:hypothetical protein [Streptomyces sp. TBY4]MCP3760144.1 hypothetical protein [Streptomyces sp. TBY4]
MPDPTNAEIHALITDLKTNIVTPFKSYVMKNEASPLVTENFLTTKLDQLAQDIKAAPGAPPAGEKPPSKAWWETLLEILGLKDLVSVIKEAGKVGIIATVLGGLVVAVAAIGLKFLDFGNMFKSLTEFLTRNSAAGPRILAPSPRGLPSLQTRQSVENPVLAAMASVPDPSTLEPLRAKLEVLNPEIAKFNTEIRRMPSASDLTKTATALGKLEQVVLRLTPQTVKDLAQEVTKLKDAVTGFDPTKLPKPQTMTQTAQAMGQVRTATDTLAGRFANLTREARLLADAVAAAPST